jgi:hypothetical protein
VGYPILVKNLTRNCELFAIATLYGMNVKLEPAITIGNWLSHGKEKGYCYEWDIYGMSILTLCACLCRF